MSTDPDRRNGGSKTMFLKNYTSDVPVSKTISRIEHVLIKCGASAISKEYLNTEGDIAAVSFQIEAPAGKVSIRLPADKGKALEALWMDYADGDSLSPNGQEVWGSARKRKKRKDFEEQAGRTAWKIIQDWIEVQMSMIQLKQADPIQVFLPYVYQNGRTFYDAVKESGYRGLLPEKTEKT